ncbi:hypothetical protein BU24DRAFT_431177 [Aaosphaeria arxii CBS 175.79]|uniref:Sequence orphan n=1 Tax=Aaosphaeria arxii CBS 175.79 TaxID=1450172 RepID=A0A6A5Y1H6_9PLEO|nr:uncharacterized protein BU24DRAFT_431177 [Aaosphaeria arxii CBS 175.79]KAF2019322.1 hypothetical protein BU24DRAFT_431177 [Aaosphaeria arxii CBS 175.79]
MAVAAPDASKDSTMGKTWNTNKLGLRVGVDVVSACSAAALVAPIITAIDKGIMENASGRNTLGQSLKSSAMEILTKPTAFFGRRAFFLIFTVYSGTYITANSIDTVNSTISNKPIHTTTAGASKFFATSGSNIGLGLYKDSQFTKMFGSASSAGSRPVPLPTFALFTIRDCLTVFASFNLPTVLSPHFDARMSSEVKKYVGATSAAQFFAPAAVQLISTPLHLWGLDLYNRPGVSLPERFTRVSRDWLKSAFARMGRIVPAFGVGGVVNTKVRRNLMGKLES